MSEIMPASTHTPIEDPYSILTSNTAHHLKAAPNSGTNPFIVKQPRPTENTQSGTNPFRNAPSATYASPAENTVSTMGTLMSPDRDAKAAAQAMGNITTGTDKDTIAVGAENSVNHETAGEDSKATTNPPRDALQMIGDNIAMNGDNPVDANGDPGVDASVEDGKEDGHARKVGIVCYTHVFHVLIIHVTYPWLSYRSNDSTFVCRLTNNASLVILCTKTQGRGEGLSGENENEDTGINEISSPRPCGEVNVIRTCEKSVG